MDGHNERIDRAGTHYEMMYRACNRWLVIMTASTVHEGHGDGFCHVQVRVCTCAFVQ